MGLLDLFRRRPAPIREAGELADFIDRHGAFLAQKGIYEYARARAGHYAKVLFREPEFLATCDNSRWQTFPLALAMVGEMVEGALLQSWPSDRLSLNRKLRDLTLSVYDRYAIPAALPAPRWLEQRSDLDRYLSQASLHPPKSPRDIPEPFWQRYFDLMPIHEKLRTRDELTTRGFLQITLINIHDELTKRLDADAVIRDLGGAEVAAG